VSSSETQGPNGDARRRVLVVAGLIAGDDGRVLLTRRRADQAFPLKWEFPGGKIEAGESPEQALARELAEEIGVTAEVGRIWEVLYHDAGDFELIMLVYSCRLAPGAVAEPIEVAEVAWVPVTHLDRYDILEADAPLIARLRQERQTG
jgi:8-oxo-dGTP diphosphatase